MGTHARRGHGLGISENVAALLLLRERLALRSQRCCSACGIPISFVIALESLHRCFYVCERQHHKGS